MPTYKEVLRINEQYAIDNNKEATAIKLLLQYFSGVSSTELIHKLDEQMEDAMYKPFLKAVDDYIIRHKPVQHITGCEYFYGYRFCVNKDVLIPRYETEELVTHVLDAIDEYFEDKAIKLVDIGTGSGCLAITLAKEKASVTAYATDISKDALDIAKINNKDLNANVTFYEGDMLKPLIGQKFDVLVSNPPYIPNDEVVDPLVKDYEPHIALFGGEDGLDFYREILKHAESILNDRYIIAFEHAYDKSKSIKKLIKKHIKDGTIIQKKDMQGKDRMTLVIKK